MAYVERPGVILGVDPAIGPEAARDLTEQLSERFPGVMFAVVPGVLGGLAFPWFEEVDDDPVQRG